MNPPSVTQLPGGTEDGKLVVLIQGPSCPEPEFTVTVSVEALVIVTVEFPSETDVTVDVRVVVDVDAPLMRKPAPALPITSIARRAAIINGDRRALLPS